VQRDERRVADALEDRAAHALADELCGKTGHSERLVERVLDPDCLQRASREAKRLVGIAARLGGAGPAIEDDAE
jgi:hypothetical protein